MPRTISYSMFWFFVFVMLIGSAIEIAVNYENQLSNPTLMALNIVVAIISAAILCHTLTVMSSNHKRTLGFAINAFLIMASAFVFYQSLKRVWVVNGDEFDVIFIFVQLMTMGILLITYSNLGVYKVPQDIILSVGGKLLYPGEEYNIFPLIYGKEFAAENTKQEVAYLGFHKVCEGTNYSFDTRMELQLHPNKEMGSGPRPSLRDLHESIKQTKERGFEWCNPTIKSKDGGSLASVLQRLNNEIPCQNGEKLLVVAAIETSVTVAKNQDAVTIVSRGWHYT